MIAQRHSQGVALGCADMPFQGIGWGQDDCPTTNWRMCRDQWVMGVGFDAGEAAALPNGKGGRIDSGRGALLGLILCIAKRMRGRASRVIDVRGGVAVGGRGEG